MEIGTQEQAAPSYKHVGNAHDPEYDAYLARLQARFLSRVDGDTPLFETTATGLFDAYLAAFPAEVRQYHNCHSCKRFVDRVGGLVVVGDDGRTRSAFWDEDDAPDIYKPSVRAMEKLVLRAAIERPWLAKEAVWGEPHTGIWTHLSLTPPREHLYRGAVLTPGQAMAEKVQDYITVSRALSEFEPAHVDLAVKLLKSDQLYRSEKVLGQAEWLQRLHAARAAVSGSTARKNVTWVAVAKAPAGFCHPRASMIGTLLQDIAAGKPYEDVARAFAAKMHPLAYQRPQAAPTTGAIKQAEDLFAKLGLASALRRRMARLDEIQALWRPPATQPVERVEGVFAHLRPKGATRSPADMVTPAITITWEKFARTVLPDAAELELLIPMRGGFAAMVTAADPEAPPLLQWDRPEQRNPVSWYLWHGGSPATQWGLRADTYAKVAAISHNPAHWFGGEAAHHAKSLFLIVEGARETRSAGLALFPECLRSELHGVRSVIEAHSRTGEIEDMANGSACGLMLSVGKDGWSATVRVTSKGGDKQAYRLDRMD